MPGLFDIHKASTQGKTVLDPNQSMLRQISTLSEPSDNISSSDTSSVGGPSANVLPVVDFTKYPLIPFTDSRLLTRPAAFNFEEPNYTEYAPNPMLFADAMYRRMLALNGVGLSANQLGIPLRMFVFGDYTTRHYIFNPEVVGVSEEMSLMEERCLSFPGFSLTLKRPSKAGVAFQDETGGWFTSTLGSMSARVFLHEYDHMEGITFLHWASKAKRDWEMNKVVKKLDKLKKHQKLALTSKNKEAHGKTNKP